LKDVNIHPFVKAHWDEIAPFHRKLFERVAKPLYILIAIMLELPEDYFISRNAYDKRSEDWLRWMMHPPRPREYYDAVESYGIGGHTDQSSLTLLFEQNVVGLQMLTTEGVWKWVKPVPGGITINAGELFSHLTKGYVKATIHRVHAPVDDQLGEERLGCIYFSLMNVRLSKLRSNGRTTPLFGLHLVRNCFAWVSSHKRS
jgi:isopenicillin N synthase-like dioxygenase